MLAIRFQRVGRTGHAEFRIIVQEAHRTPSSGRIVAQIGHYNPHTKATVLDKEKATFYVTNGAQPSTRVALLMKSEGVTLPSWVKIDASKARTVKNADKLRKNQPAAEVVAEEPAAVEEVATEEAPAAEAEAPAETVEA
jgi:small subunit ribosomal protein S16